MSITSKIKNLIDSINTFDKIIIAYSGGLDSSLLAYLCKQLGKQVLAVTANSKIHFYDEIKEAKRFARKYKIPHLIITTEELKNKKFVKNTPLRCYYCKLELFKKLIHLKKRYNYNIIFDGVNLDDVENDYRPGIKAANELGIVHPYVQSKITKQDIREIAKRYKLSIWNKPNSTCLATRIPFGIKITEKILRTVYNTEKIIKLYWQGFFRARYHNEILRIEIKKDDQKNFFAKVNLDKLIPELKSLGYKFITLDLEGYIPCGNRHFKL